MKGDIYFCKIYGFECYHSNFSETEIEYMCRYCKENIWQNIPISGRHGFQKY